MQDADTPGFAVICMKGCYSRVCSRKGDLTIDSQHSLEDHAPAFQNGRQGLALRFMPAAKKPAPGHGSKECRGDDTLESVMPFLAFPAPSNGVDLGLLEIYDREIKVAYRGETYLVRDNGAVHRRRRSRQKVRALDEAWSFGRQTLSTGYLNLAGVPVHRIVCTAFQGDPPSDQHVVDHIDTNRANNRPENLRWVTRLENVLLNPISARRIELVYGSIEAFFEDPGRLQSDKQYPDISWMRTVSKEEAASAKGRLEAWALSGDVPSGGALGEWLYGTRERADFEPEPEEYESLSPSVVQVRWKVPTEFPECPKAVSDDALAEYASALYFGRVFACNDIYQSVVVQCGMADDGLVVLTHNPSENAAKSWAVAHVAICGEFFYHRNEHQYFSLQGALKAFCELTGDSYDECIDDYC
ncbi:HNH endonuclease signature motif containing protein [Paracoccus litorisediminis]|nr:HNH endonuclease signature motif containing protein [Paracoccus litorisediminis]